MVRLVHNVKTVSKNGIRIYGLVAIGFMLLFFPGIIPVLGPFVAGIIVGFLSKSNKKAIIASIMSSMLITIAGIIFFYLIVYFGLLLNTFIAPVLMFGNIWLFIGLFGAQDMLFMSIGALVGNSVNQK